MLHISELLSIHHCLAYICACMLDSVYTPVYIVSGSDINVQK